MVQKKNNKNPDNTVNKTKFNIYRLNTENNFKDVLKKIKNKISQKYGNSKKLNKDGFQGFIFFSNSIPGWADCILDLLDSDEKTINIENSYSSYILLREINGNIYAITGGYGYLLIQDCLEQDFGLSLIPKLCTENDNIVKKIVENRVIGNLIFDHRRNLNSTPLKFEDNFANIYKELGIEIDEEKAKKLGISFDEETFKSITGIYKNFISINRAFSIDELNNLIDKIDLLSKESNNFNLGSFIHIEKTDYDSKEIDEKFVNLFLEMLQKKDEGKGWNSLNFSIIGENKSEYFEYDKYSFIYTHNSHNLNVYNGNKLLTLNDLQEKIYDTKVRITPKLVRDVFNKGKLVVESDNLKPLKGNLINFIEGYMEDEKNDETFYLLNGNWYILEEKFQEFISNQFKDIYNNYMYTQDTLLEKFPSFKTNWYKTKEIAEKNKREGKRKDINITESIYNEQFENDENIIFADKCNVNNIEIADLIFLDKSSETLYLMCIKTKFKGATSRDLFGQIEISSNYILKSYQNSNRSKEYYDVLVKENRITCDFERFKYVFDNYNICYVAAFMFNLKEDSKSFNGKFFTFKADKLLKDNGFDFLLCDLNFSE